MVASHLGLIGYISQMKKAGWRESVLGSGQSLSKDHTCGWALFGTWPWAQCGWSKRYRGTGERGERRAGGRSRPWRSPSGVRCMSFGISTMPSIQQVLRKLERVKTFWGQGWGRLSLGCRTQSCQWSKRLCPTWNETKSWVDSLSKELLGGKNGMKWQKGNQGLQCQNEWQRGSNVWRYHCYRSVATGSLIRRSEPRLHVGPALHTVRSRGQSLQPAHWAWCRVCLQQIPVEFLIANLLKSPK